MLMMENWTKESNTTDNTDVSNQTLFVIQLLCYTAIIFVGTLGNIIIFCSIMLKKKRKISDNFIMNLTIADLLSCVVSIPFDIMERILGYWPLGLLMCKIVYPLQTIIMAVAVGTLLFMAFERHRAIMHPLKPKIYEKWILFKIIILWIFAVVLVSPYMIVLKMDDSGSKCTENWPAPVFVKAFTTSVFVLLYAVPLSIITAAYIRVGVRLRRGSKSFRNAFGSSAEGQNVIRARARRHIHVVKIFISAVIAFAVCLLPFHIMWLWYDFGDAKHYNHYYDLLTFANILAYSNSAINPFIFGSLSKRFRSCSFFRRAPRFKRSSKFDRKALNRKLVVRMKLNDFTEMDRLNNTRCDRQTDSNRRNRCDRQTDSNRRNRCDRQTDTYDRKECDRQTDAYDRKKCDRQTDGKEAKRNGFTDRDREGSIWCDRQTDSNRPLIMITSL